jgi:hypothetical protein
MRQRIAFECFFFQAILVFSYFPQFLAAEQRSWQEGSGISAPLALAACDCESFFQSFFPKAGGRC